MTTKTSAARIAFIAAFVILALTLVPVALAGKGGHSGTNGGGGGHKGGGGGSTSTASLTATPNPATVGAQVALSGCGYSFVPAEVRITEPDGYVLTYAVGVWSSGCLDSMTFVPALTGTYALDVYQKSSTKRNATWVLKASTTLVVQ